MYNHERDQTSQKTDIKRDRNRNRREARIPIRRKKERRKDKEQYPGISSPRRDDIKSPPTVLLFPSLSLPAFIKKRKGR